MAALKSMPGTSYIKLILSLSIHLLFLRRFSIYFQKILDLEAIEVGNRQDAADKSRKKLIELTRDFKKNTEEVSFEFLFEAARPGFNCKFQGNFSEPCNELSLSSIKCLHIHLENFRS